tara:strand:- start:496 stop:1131 length:636 start_codon:yes stop_codon:yes gene_type:complete
MKQQNIPKFIQLLKNDLKSKLPGKKAHDAMRIGRRIPKTIDYIIKTPVPSAVLILLYPKNKTFNFILTLRSNKVESHKGQISLPGGVQEKNETLSQTALRESNEEIGVKTEIIELIGKLSTIYVPFSGFKIYPYVGWTSKAPDLKASEDEVEKIIEISIDELINNNNQRKKNTTIRGVPISMPYFNLNKEIVWGATSMILSEFKEIIKQIA